MDDSNLLKDKLHIIEIGKQLHEIGLIQRTWGNVSSRYDNDYMLITPSGIQYEDLTPEMIVKVKLSDLSYEGDYLPSSELKVHAAAYKVRKDCNFIIHTHQVYASCAGSLGVKRIFTYYDDEDLIIPVAPYALAGTDKLAAIIAQTFKKYKSSNGIIMSNHGTICLGRNSNEAFFEAEMLETACNNFLIDVCKMDVPHGVEAMFNSHLVEGKIVYDIKDTPERVKRVHEEIYAKRPDVNYIIHNKSAAIMFVSRRANHIRPLLEDFVQLIGTSVKIPSNVGEVDHNINKKVNVVFVPNDGAFCFGSTEDEADAAALVLDKGCLAYMAVLRNGEGHYIPFFDCLKLNRNYRKKYSKLAKLGEH